MPFSSQAGKSSIKWVMSKIPTPKTALDIGCGSGTYAKMFPNIQWTGVEIWEPYVEKYNLKSLYPDLIIKDVRKWNTDKHFDVCFLGDVLEHMSEKEAQKLVSKCCQLADTIIISIPLGPYPQGEYDGNPYEKHVTDNWTHEKFEKTFGLATWSAIDGGMGVYVFSQFGRKLRLNICVYAISKNEAHFVPRFMEGAKEADLVLIADTGSTDGLPEKAEELGAKVHHICISPWRFDRARDSALSLIPRDVDVCISLDIDEVLQPGWREEIERIWKPGITTRLRYKFDWGCGIVFYYEKIHARHGYGWKHPCHEYPMPDGRITEVWAQTDMLLAIHKPDPTKSRGQYIDLLELSVKEDPDCPRNAFYYARELSFHARWQESIDACNRYLKLPRADWPNERCYAYRVMGRCYSEMRNPREAERHFQLAAFEAPDTREPWCELAMLMYRQNRWAECYAASIRALRIVDRELVYTCDPEVWGHWPHDLAGIAAWHLGMKEEALKHTKNAVELSPHDKRLLANLAMMERELQPKPQLEAAE